ncbi:MAG: DUF5665 domain-containing protein [Clostridiales bacterium]
MTEKIVVRRKKNYNKQTNTAKNKHKPIIDLQPKTETNAEEAVEVGEQADSSFCAKNIEKLAYILERIHFQDYIYYTLHPWRMIFNNLLAGMAKGFGLAIGFTVLAFIAFYVLRSLNVLELPYIGDFIADLLEYIDTVRGIRPY